MIHLNGHFIGKVPSILPVTEVFLFSLPKKKRNYIWWSHQKVCEALTFLLDNIYIRFGTKLFRQIVGIPMGTNCAPLVAYLFLFCFDRDFMMSLYGEKQFDIIKAFQLGV